MTPKCAKIAKGKDVEKRYILSRHSGNKNAKTANLVSVLRRNGNLMIPHVIVVTKGSDGLAVAALRETAERISSDEHVTL